MTSYYSLGEFARICFNILGNNNLFLNKLNIELTGNIFIGYNDATEDEIAVENISEEVIFENHSTIGTVSLFCINSENCYNNFHINTIKISDRSKNKLIRKNVFLKEIESNE
ncbi:MAG: hypothetical protein ABII85_05490 [Bacillota bacterium]